MLEHISLLDDQYKVPLQQNNDARSEQFQEGVQFVKWAAKWTMREGSQFRI